MTPAPWSEAEDAYLRQAYGRGQSLADIARFLGRTVYSVEARRYRLRIGSSLSRSEARMRSLDFDLMAKRGCARLLRAQLRAGQHNLQSADAIRAAWDSVEGIAA